MIDTRHGLVFALLAVVACTGSTAPDSDSSGEAIVGGKKATSFPEAVFIDASDFLCSGAVVAPRIVLTAGHCIYGASSWDVTAPYASNQTAHASKHWTAYIDGGDSVNPSSNDVAVLILDTPITLASYPTIASSPVPNGTKVIDVGRIRNDEVSSTDLFYGKQVTLRRGGPEGWPYEYISAEVIEDGDSGGPAYTTDGSHTIVAVSSGGGGGTQLLARVDLAYAKIQSLIAANGGAGPTGGSDAGTPPPDPGGGAPDPGAGSCWSPTLGEDVAALGCVQSASNSVWFQCHDGEWYRGGDDTSGPFGDCTSSHPL